MKFNDFLIIDIGESFVFYSKLRFYADKGYKVISSKKSRIPKYIDISELVKEYESTNSQVFFLSNSFIDNNLSASSTFILNSAKYWKTNLAFLSKNLGLDSLGFLHISSSEIIFTNGREIKSFESDDLYWEFIRTNKSYLKKTGLDEDQLLNFLSAPPLPQQVTDYYKSFHISFKFVDFIFERFKEILNVDYLIVDSEWYRSGFFDQSAFIEGVKRRNNSITKISFDTGCVWKLLMNDTLDQFTHLRHLNKNVFYPEFTLVPYSKQKLIVRNFQDTNKEFYLLEDSQKFILQQDQWFIEDNGLTGENNIYVIDKKQKIEGLLKLDIFKIWYKFYKYSPYKYSPIVFDDKNEHIIKMDSIFLSDIDNNIDISYEYYDVEKKLGNSKRIEYSVLHGEKVQKGDILAQITKTGGIFISKLKAKRDGIVEVIDKKRGWIVLKYVEEQQKRLEYEFIRHINKFETEVRIYGMRVDCAKIWGGRNLTKLTKYKGKNTPKYSAIWFEDLKDVSEVLDKIDIYQPSSIIIPTITIRELDLLFGRDFRNLKMMNIVLINGFDTLLFSDRQKRFFELNEGKNILIEESESSIYLIEENGKFDAKKAPPIYYPYSIVYTFEDWNLQGEMIYNDQDSVIFRSFEKKNIFDIAEYNIIQFNHE